LRLTSHNAVAGMPTSTFSAIHMCYNFCRVHQTLRVTPAMEAGISLHVWRIVEIVGLPGASDRKAA
jgi:hypothetical protein